MFGIGIWELIVISILFLPPIVMIIVANIKYKKLLKNDTKRW